jgi:hypothetical protein
MALEFKIAILLIDITTGLILALLRVTTNGTSESPSVMSHLLELQEASAQRMNEFEINIIGHGEPYHETAPMSRVTC